jgi:hypothetical protein
MLYLMIPLGMLVLTIALAPVLAVAVLPDRETRARHDEPVRLPWGLGGTADVPVPAVVESGRTRHRAA